jgi:ribosomal protein L28
MTSFVVKFPKVASFGHTVSHAKNRRSRTFSYNLRTVTIKDDQGKKVRMKVPVKVMRTFKKYGLR